MQHLGDKKHTQENTAEGEDSWKQETLRGEWKYVKTKEAIDHQDEWVHWSAEVPQEPLETSVVT